MLNQSKSSLYPEKDDFYKNRIANNKEGFFKLIAKNGFYQNSQTLYWGALFLLKVMKIRTRLQLIIYNIL